MNNPAKSVRPGVASAGAPTDQTVIDKFFAGWPTFNQLPANSSVRNDVKAFLAGETPEERRAALEKANLQARLHSIYAKEGVLRADQASVYADAVALSAKKLAEAIRGGNPQEPLGTLQKAFGFGRFPAVAQQQAASVFLLEFFSLLPGGPSMKYCTYAKGLPFSAGGKTHEEAARVFVSSGYGSGNPLGGGQIARSGAMKFEYDVSCTAFRGGVRPEEVKAGIQRWIRATGGDETKPSLKLVPAAG
jgi:hypothetical protein